MTTDETADTTAARPRRRIAALAGSALAVAALLVGASSPATAAGTLVTDVTEVHRGDTLTATAGGCTSDDTFERFVQMQLISGTGDGSRVAGLGVADATFPTARIVVPTWIAPDQPLTLIADCIEYDLEAVESQGTVAFAFPEVALTLLPDLTTPPAQTVTLSRTSGLGGQSILVSGVGCGLDPGKAGELEASVLVFPGEDLGLLPIESAPITGYATVVDGSFEIELVLASTFDDEPLPAGPYVVVPYCVDASGQTVQSWEPQQITIGEPAAPPITLDAVGDGTAVVAAGTRCSSSVFLAMLAIPDEAFEPDQPIGSDDPGDPEETVVSETFVSRADRRAWTVGAADPGSVGASPRQRLAATRDGEDEAMAFEGEVTPDADGTWSQVWDPQVRKGDIVAAAICGDPLGEGFYYLNVAVLRLDVEEVPVEVPEQGTPPAGPISGEATFAG